MLILGLGLCHAVAWAFVIARMTQPRVRELSALMWVLPCLVVAWLFRDRIADPAAVLGFSAATGIGVRWISDGLRLYAGTERLAAAGRDPLKITENPGPVPTEAAESFLKVLRGRTVALAAGADGFTWPEALSQIEQRVRLGGGQVVESADNAEYVISVGGFAFNAAEYQVAAGAQCKASNVPQVRKRFRTYSLLFSRRRPEQDLARDAVYDLGLLIRQADSASTART
jgi:hypothetical protein